MSDTKTHESGRKRPADAEANIVSRTLSSLFKRRRRSTPAEPLSSSRAKIEIVAEEKKIEDNSSPKLSSPLPPLNLASTRLNKPSSNNTGKNIMSEETESSLPRFSIGRSDSTATKSGLRSKNRARARSGVYSRSRTLSSSSLIQPPNSMALGRSRSSRPRRKPSTATIGTFSVGESVDFTNSKSKEPGSFTKMRRSTTSRLIERCRKNGRRKRITSKMTTDLVNRALKAQEGLLFPPRATTSDLGLGKSSAGSNATLKVSVVGKYKVGGSRLNQPHQNNLLENGPKPPSQTLVSQQQIHPASTSMSQSRGVRFNMSLASKSPKSDSSTTAPPKRMPSVKTPAFNRQVPKSPLFSKPPVATSGTKSAQTPPSISSTKTNALNAETPLSTRKRSNEHLLLSDVVDSDFVFTPIASKASDKISLQDAKEYERRSRSAKKNVLFHFSHTPKMEQQPKKRIKRGTPYPNKVQKETKKKETSVSSTLHFDSVGSANDKKTPVSPKLVMEGWGSNMYAKPGEWSCGTCLTKNPKEKTICMACLTPRDGSAAKDTNGDTQKSTSEKSSFTFGSSSEEKKENTATVSKFTFGVKKDSKQTGETKINSENTNSTSKTNGFTFGTKKEETKTKPSGVGGFTFGTKKEETKTKPSGAGGFTFGTKKAETQTKSSNEGKFTFGAKKAETKTSTSKVIPVFDAKKIEPKTTPSKGGFELASVKDQKTTQPQTGGFTFGAKKEENATSSSTAGGFTFGSKKEDAKPSSANSATDTKLEGGKSNTGSFGGFTFGAKIEEKESKTSGNASSFQFGANKTAPTTQPLEKKTEGVPKFSFNGTKSSSSISLPVPSIQSSTTEDASRKKKRSIVPENEKTPASAFSIGATGASAASTTFSFGGKKSTDPITANTSQFGTATTQAPKSSSQPSFTFGSSSSTAAPPAPAPVNPSIPASSTPSFAFGSTPTPAAPKTSIPAPSFSFNATSSSVPSASKNPPVSFGSSSNPAGTTAPVSVPAPVAANFSFGQTQQPAVAQQQPQNSFNFGAGASAPAAPPAPQPSFGFGAGNNMASATPAAPAPQFGAGGFGPQGASSAGGFGAPANTASGGFNSGFGSNMAMTGGGGGFSIGTGGTKAKGRTGATPRRRIKARRPPSMK